MKVTIYCGVPGSGKTTFIAGQHKHCPVYSADKYFEDEEGNYDFDPAKLGEAHGQCLRFFVESLQKRDPEVVVDNTNTTVAEIAPYAALAQAYGYELHIITLTCDPEVAYKRNVHGVPFAGIEAAHKRLMARELPPWWPHTQVTVEMAA